MPTLGHGQRVELVRDLDIGNGWLLSVDGVAQSYVDLDDPTHLEFAYIRAMASVIDACLAPDHFIEAVHLGGGGATLPRYIAATRPGSPQLVVELDQEVVALAIDRLGLLDVAGLTLVVGDARETLDAQPDASADLVVSDVFDGSTVPARLLTTEAFNVARRVLRTDGLYIANIADSTTFDFARPVVAAMTRIFPAVAMLAEPPSSAADDSATSCSSGRRHRCRPTSSAAAGRVRSRRYASSRALHWRPSSETRRPRPTTTRPWLWRHPTGRTPADPDARVREALRCLGGSRPRVCRRSMDRCVARPHRTHRRRR